MSDRLLVLAWHNVESTWCYPAPSGAGVDGLARQLGRLKQTANVVPLASALDALESGRPLPARAVALTFDDGYRDNLDLALPLLERLELPATFFLVPGILSKEVRPWWEVLGWAFSRSGRAKLDWGGRALPTRGSPGRRSFRWVSARLLGQDRQSRDSVLEELCELLEPEGQPDEHSMFLDWEGARALVERGFTVGSHSMFHAILSREESQAQQRDLVESRRQLEAELGVPMRLLAYPNGTRSDYNAATRSAAARAGHSHAFGTHFGLTGRSTSHYAAPRVLMRPHRGFLANVTRRLAADLPYRARRLAGRVGDGDDESDR